MSTCRSCGAVINWIETKKGKKMPVDPGDIEFDDAESGDVLVSELGDVVYVKEGSKNEHPHQKYYISHFATCPQADDWRKSK